MPQKFDADDPIFVTHRGGKMADRVDRSARDPGGSFARVHAGRR